MCPSLDEWMKKMRCIYTVKFYKATKKKEHLPFATAWIDLKNIMLSKINQSERDKNTILPHSDVGSNEQKKLTNKRNPEAWTHGTD